MSLARQFFRELRPLVNMLEEPLNRSAYYGLPSRPLFEHPFFHSPEIFRPALDLTEEGNSYVIEAELPGVKRENLEVSVGEDGRSLTIEGRMVSRRNGQPVVESKAGADIPSGNTDATVVSATPDASPSHITAAGKATFTRTVWLPRPIDSNKIVAKLSDGILHVTIPKAEDKGSTKIRVE